MNRQYGYVRMIKVWFSTVLHKSLFCGYSLESKEYPQHRFLWSGMENYSKIIIKYPHNLFRSIQGVNSMYTVMILSFRTDMPGQTVQTQIRLSSVISVYTVCHFDCIVWTHYSMVEPHSSNFRVITTNFWGVQIFRKFTVCTRYWPAPTIFHAALLHPEHVC